MQVHISDTCTYHSFIICNLIYVATQLGSINNVVNEKYTPVVSAHNIALLVHFKALVAVFTSN